MKLKENLVKILVLSMSLAGIYSCSSDDDDDDDFDSRNVKIRFDMKYDTLGFDQDQIYLNDFGQRFKITKLDFLVSDAYVIDVGDSIPFDSVSIAGMNNRLIAVGDLENGGYSGRFGFQVGLNLTRNILFPQFLGANHPLKNDWHFGDSRGYKFLVIEGAVDTSDAQDREPTMPFSYQIGATQFGFVKSQARTFSVGANRIVAFDYSFDVEVLLDGVNFINQPTATSDPTKPADFALSTIIATNFENAINLQ